MGKTRLMALANTYTTPPAPYNDPRAAARPVTGHLLPVSIGDDDALAVNGFVVAAPPRGTCCQHPPPLVKEEEESRQDGTFKGPVASEERDCACGLPKTAMDPWGLPGTANPEARQARGERTTREANEAESLILLLVTRNALP